MRKRGLEIDFDVDGIKSIISQFQASEKQVTAALRTTYNRMGRWVRTRAMRGLSSELKIQQAILRSRVRSFRFQGGISKKGEGAKVWFGLRPIPLSRLNARKARGGVRAAGGRYVEGAFIANYHGRRQVLKREGRARFPVNVVYAEIAEKSQLYIEDELLGVGPFESQFLKFFEHELKWRTQILK